MLGNLINKAGSLSQKQGDNLYCIDASVLVNSFIAHEDHHEASRQLMERIKRKGLPVILP